MAQIEKWTSYELNILFDCCTRLLSDREIRKYLPNRTIGAINTKRSKLGLVKEEQWTEEENKILMEKYPIMPSKDVAKYLPHKSKNAIVLHAENLGISGYRPYTYYTQDDYDFIRDNYQEMNDEELALALGKCRASVKNKRNKLGYHRWTPHETVYESVDVYIRRHNTQWKKDSMKNCNYKCIVTGERFDEVHHLVSQNQILRDVFDILGYDKDAFDINKLSDDAKKEFLDTFYTEQSKHPLGICLRKDIHKQFHDIYGYGNNTIEQFEEFLDSNYPNINIA